MVMSETPLIRRVVTADRGQRRKHRHVVTVSTEAVIECVGELPDQWSTRDVAEKIGVSERAVRASIQWLAVNGMIRSVASIERRVRGDGQIYRVRVYEVVPVSECDVGLLNRIFLGVCHG